MWIDDKNAQDPYNRLATPHSPTTATVGAGGGAGGAGQPTGTQSNPSTQVQAGSAPQTQNFATVQDYLGANKTQGEDLGQKFTGSLDTAATNEKNTIGQAATQTKNDISAGTTNYDANLANTALTDPTKVANDPGQLNSFLSQWNAAYKGPSSFETSSNYGKAADAATEAQQKQAQVGTAGGQQQLIQDQFGVYGQGNKGLDQALLQNSSSYKDVLVAPAKFQGIQDYLGQQATDVNAAATAGKTASDAARTNTQNLFTNQISDFQKRINDEVAAARTPAAEQAAKIKADMASGDPAKVIADLKQVDPNVDATTIQQYLTAMNAQTGKPTDLSQFYEFNPETAVTASNAATAKDYADADAYGKLTGQDYSGVLNPADAAKAGTAPGAISGLRPGNVADYLKTQYTNALLTSGGGKTLDPGTPATPGVPGIPDKPQTGPTFTSRIGLPGLETIALPKNATPETIKTLTGVFNAPLSSAGTYHEGALYDAASRVQQLQGLLKNGQLDKATFDQYTKPILDLVNAYGGGATGKSFQVYKTARQNFHATTGL
jgi:hypothetical protein